MNGIDFLEKIKDIDDDLLTLETPAVETNLRRRTLIISLASAAAVFLIIGGLLFVPNFLNEKSSSTVKTKKSADKIVAEGTLAEDSDYKDSSSEIAKAYEDPEDNAELENAVDSDAEAMEESDDDSDSNLSKDYVASYSQGDTNILDSNVKYYGSANQFTDEDVADFMQDNYSLIKMTLMEDGVDVSDLKISDNGYVQLVVSDMNEVSVFLNSRTYIASSDGKFVAFIKVTSDSENGFELEVEDKNSWVKTSGDFFEKHDGEKLVYVCLGDEEVFFAENEAFCSSTKGIGKLYDEKFGYYEQFATEYNTIMIELGS